MQLRHLREILPHGDVVNKVTAMCWSPNGRRLAVVTMDRVVHLYDENGERKDKFSTKPGNPDAVKGKGGYIVKGMAFSPDSTKLAIAQSDNIVFVYKLGEEWGDKKSICNKFPMSGSVTCLAWPPRQPNEVCFGLDSGKVKVGQLRNNKPATLYAAPGGSLTVACCATFDGLGIVTGHASGEMFRFTFDDGVNGPSHVALGSHSCAPYALACGESIVAGGLDLQVVFYAPDGKVLQKFDHGKDAATIKEFTAACFNPSGDSCVLGAFNHYVVFQFNLRRNSWEEVAVKRVENLYTVTSLAWKTDGSKLALGNLTGGVDVFDACLRRSRYKGKFEFTYVSISQVIVKRLSTGSRIVLKSHFGYEILRIDVEADRFLVARTPETLLMGDMETCKLSEIPWSGSGNETFHFGNPTVCMIYNAGELTLVEYGRNEVLGSCRTEHMAPNLVSVRIRQALGPDGLPLAEDEDGGAQGGGLKRIAYLLDLQTVQVADLGTGTTRGTINHEANVDWLELNLRGTHLLFRDKNRHLSLYDIEKGERTTLLTYCSFVQWVPRSDVVVAQNRGNLCIWYSISSPEKVTVFPIKGEVEVVERAEGRTEVIVDEGINTVSYALDEALIAFGTALEDNDLFGAVDILEPLEVTPETEAMWKQLAELSLQQRQLIVAEQAYAALCDVAKVRYLHKLNKLAAANPEVGVNHYMVRTKLAMLEKKWDEAEAIMLDNGKVEDLMQLFIELHKWEDAIRVAERVAHPELNAIKANYFAYLLSSGQSDKAGAIKESEGDVMGAIDLYLKAGMGGRAAKLVTPERALDAELVARICSAMVTKKLFEGAGAMMERLGQGDRAMELYKQGHCYRRAVQLAKKSYPGQVVQLEGQWGDWLCDNKNEDQAVAHYVEAGDPGRALDAALKSKQLKKAAEILDNFQVEDAERPGGSYAQQLAHEFESVKQFSEAERFFVKARKPFRAVEMYTKIGKWDEAHKVAVTHLTREEAATLYVSQAQNLEMQGKLKDAEKMYLAVDEPDMAINMYKKARQFDQMIRLVSTWHKDLLGETHILIAQQCESDGQLKQAEHHFVEGKQWQLAVNMYRANDAWDDAIRVAKLHGGINASKRVAFAWATHLGGEAGANLLSKFGLIEQAIDFAMENAQFAEAFDLVERSPSMEKKLGEVHLKYALYLEDEGRFGEAETHFVKAEKPKEAIDMFVHQQDWDAAMRVAENHDPSSIAEVICAEAKVAGQGGDWVRAETLFLKAKKPDQAIKMFKEASMWDDAIRMAEDFMPHKVPELHAELAASMKEQAAGGDGRPGAGGQGKSIVSNPSDILAKGKELQKDREYSRAIDTFLLLTQDSTSNLDMLEESWGLAVKLALAHVHKRSGEVIQIVAKRLVRVDRHEPAAALYENVGQYKEAVDVFIAGQLWDRARSLAARQAPDLTQYIETAFVEAMKEGDGNAEALIEAGNMDEGMDLYAQRGEWDKVYKHAKQQGQGVLNRYSVLHARKLTHRGDPDLAAIVLARYGSPATADFFPFYMDIARDVLGRTAEDEEVAKVPANFDGSGCAALVGKAAVAEACAAVATMAKSVASAVKHSKDKSVKEYEATFSSLGLTAHRVAMSAQCAAHNDAEASRGGGDLFSGEFLARQAAAMLRHAGTFLPVDKAFYLAGTAAKDAKLQTPAFVFLNRYLDLSEAIEDGDTSMLDNSDFSNTDFPMDFKLPEKQYVGDAPREGIRDYVLAVSMDTNLQQTLGLRYCDSCGEQTYEGAQRCHHCGKESSVCVVTGWPIQPGSVFRPKSCDMPANADDWNDYVLRFRACPWSGQPVVPSY